MIIKNGCNNGGDRAVGTFYFEAGASFIFVTFCKENIRNNNVQMKTFAYRSSLPYVPNPGFFLFRETISGCVDAAAVLIFLNVTTN